MKALLNILKPKINKSRRTGKLLDSKANLKKALMNIKESIFNENEQEYDKRSSLYAYMEASIHTFLPKVPIEDYNKKIKQVIFNSKKIEIERMSKKVNENMILDEFHPIKDTGFILGSYHYGPYRNISIGLIKRNLNFFIVTNDIFSEADKQLIQDQLKTHKKRYKHTISEIPILDVQDPTFIFKAKELLNKGTIMLIFIDGSSGLDGSIRKNNKEVDIDFLDNRIGVRSGIPELAHAFNVPILPVVATRMKNEDTIEIKSFDPIYPDRKMKRKEFGHQTIKKLYKILETQVRKEPFEWEGWIYAHKLLDKKTLKPKVTVKDERNNQLKFNDKKYTFYSVLEKKTKQNVFFLLDKDTHLSYKVDDNIYGFLKGKVKQIDSDTQKVMITKEILI